MLWTMEEVQRYISPLRVNGSRKMAQGLAASSESGMSEGTGKVRGSTDCAAGDSSVLSGIWEDEATFPGERAGPDR